MVMYVCMSDNRNDPNHSLTTVKDSKPHHTRHSDLPLEHGCLAVIQVRDQPSAMQRHEEVWLHVFVKSLLHFAVRVPEL